MSTNKLIDEHRRSIANLNEDAGCRVDVDALTGVTLSRRHTLSQQEYNDGLVCLFYNYCYLMWSALVVTTLLSINQKQETGTFEELRGYEFKEEG